jgi:peptide/nickel transport system substrate-binding protein
MSVRKLRARRSIVAVLAAAGVAGAVLLVASASASGRAEKRGGASAANTLTIAVPNAPASWDQDYLAFDLTGLALDKNYYPYMIDYGVKKLAGALVQNTRKVLPVFAQSFTSSHNGRVWTLKIKHGIKFPSGNPLRAADVKWSKDRAFAAQANVAGVYRLIGLTKPSQVKVLNPYTVQFSQAYPSALSSAVQIISLYVFDSKLMKQHATATDPWAKRWASQNPTDGGVYNVVSAGGGSSNIVLRANPKFPGKPKPSIPNVRLVITPSSASQKLELQNGDIDMATGLSSQDIRSLKGKRGVKIISGPSNQFNFIAMDVTKPPFDKRLVRQAMAWAIPYKSIVSSVYGGQARLSKSIVPLDMPGSSRVGYPYHYGLNKAKALLRQAGEANGFKAELVIAQGDPDQERIAVLVQNALKQIGINLTITPLDPATLNSRRGNKSIRMQIGNGQYWVNDVQYLVGTSLMPGGYLNYSNYHSAAITRLYNLSAHSANQRKRLGYFRRMQVILGKDVPWLMLGQPNFELAMRSNIKGWVQPVDGLFRLQYLRKG